MDIYRERLLYCWLGAFALVVVASNAFVLIPIDKSIVPAMPRQFSNTRSNLVVVPRWQQSSNHENNNFWHKKMIISKRKLLLPPIPKQEEEAKKLQDNFRPRWVAREFLLGVRYMIRVHSWLLIGSLARRSLIHGLLLPMRSTKHIHILSPSALPVDIAQSLDISLKSLYLQWFDMHSLMNTHILGPVLEEIVYRGLAPLYYGVSIGLGLWLLASLCRWSWILGLLHLLSVYREALFPIFFTRQYSLRRRI